MPSTHAVLGFRVFAVEEDGLLISPYRRVPWDEGVTTRMRCEEHGHTVPVQWCGCGLYAYHELDLAREDSRCISEAYLALAAVAGCGGSQVHQSGWTAQEAAVLALAPVGRLQGCRQVVQMAATRQRVPYHDDPAMLPFEGGLHARPVSDDVLSPLTAGAEQADSVQDEICRLGADTTTKAAEYMCEWLPRPYLARLSAVISRTEVVNDHRVERKRAGVLRQGIFSDLIPAALRGIGLRREAAHVTTLKPAVAERYLADLALHDRARGTFVSRIADLVTDSNDCAFILNAYQFAAIARLSGQFDLALDVLERASQIGVPTMEAPLNGLPRVRLY
jgi:hypothetical protein